MKNIYFITGVVLVIMAIAFFVLLNTDSTTPEQTTSQESTSLVENLQALEESSTETNIPGSYEIYGPQKVASAEGNLVLFFHASWCPSCRALNNNIEENLDEINNDLIILKVDYDEETELKQKYGVTTQHTLVQVDNEGNLIKKWSGGSSLEKLVSQIE